LGNNTRKVEAKIAIHAPLEAVWGVLTDYDRLADHIPGLAESQVLERRPRGARLMQVTFLIVQLFASVSRESTSFYKIPHLNDQKIN
jgi:carbon monoxide dehydrogenase subunit G